MKKVRQLNFNLHGKVRTRCVCETQMFILLKISQMSRSKGLVPTKRSYLNEYLCEI